MKPKFEAMRKQVSLMRQQSQTLHETDSNSQGIVVHNSIRDLINSIQQAPHEDK